MWEHNRRKRGESARDRQWQNKTEGNDKEMRMERGLREREGMQYKLPLSLLLIVRVCNWWERERESERERDRRERERQRESKTQLSKTQFWIRITKP